MSKIIYSIDLVAKATKRETARNLGRQARRLGESVATNFYERGTDESWEFYMGYYEKDCIGNKNGVE